MTLCIDGSLGAAAMSLITSQRIDTFFLVRLCKPLLNVFHIRSISPELKPTGSGWKLLVSF